MSNKPRQKLLLYFTLASLLLMPLRVMAGVAWEAPAELEDRPCHSVAGNDHSDIVYSSTDNAQQQDCCDDNSMQHHCSDCYTSTLLYSTSLPTNARVAYPAPSTYINPLKPVVFSNLYRPPRAVI